jgi:hypothetical protein
MPSAMFISFAFNVNKSVLKLTQVCQLHCKTQLHESILGNDLYVNHYYL